MSGDNAIALAILVPLATALGIQLAGRISDNLREGVTLAGAATLAWVVWGMLPSLFEGARPALTLTEMLPGVAIAFEVEPLGMLFAALASGLWIINSVYSIGYMRGNRVERIYREVRVNAIGGGSEEIMRDLATRQYQL